MNSGLDYNDDVTSSILLQGAPGTGLTRSAMLDIYSSLAGANKLSGMIGSSSLNQPSVSSIFDRFSQRSQSNSLTITARVNKVIKTQRKLIRQQQDLAKEISSWCNVLPSEESKILMDSFIRILESQMDVTEGFIAREQSINVQLNNVNKRERRSNDLKLKRNKMLVKLRDAENKLGDNPATTLVRENLDEIDGSVDIVEDQFVNSINNGLRQSIVEYSVILQESAATYKELSKDFLERFHLGPNLSNKENISTGNQNLQRLILQNKFCNSVLNRPIKSSSGNSFMGSASQSKYVAISQNQIGKTFDNRLDQFENRSGSSKPTKKTSSSLTKLIDDRNHLDREDEEDDFDLDEVDNDTPIKPLNTPGKELKSNGQNSQPLQIEPQYTKARLDDRNYKLELLKLQQDYKNLRLQFQQQEAELKHGIQNKIHEDQQPVVSNQNQQMNATIPNHDSAFNHILNSLNAFNTPGSLAIRPSSQVSNGIQEWNNS